MYQFSRYYEKFSNFLNVRPVQELAEPETLEAFRNSVQSENQGQPEKPVLEIERQLRLKIHEHYYNVYLKTQQDVTSRWNYEQAMQRPYFHVTELEDAELDNWRKYLEYEEKQGDFERTTFLYERCLVACALYDEFWLRYARWMFSQGKEENARIIYMRASCIFVPISAPAIRLNWARFEEKLGRTSIARDIYLAMLEQAPDHTETLVSLAGVQRRHEGNDAAVRLLEEYIGRSNTQIGGVLAAEQARILWQCKGVVDEARDVYQSKHERFLDSRDFWMKYLEFEIEQPVSDQEEAHSRIKAVHETMRTKGRFSSDVSKDLSQIYMAYLLDRGGKDAAEEYMQLDKDVNGYVSSAKSAPSPPLPQKKRKGQPHNTATKRQRK